MKLRKIGYTDQLMRRYTRKIPKNDVEEWTPLGSKAMVMLFAVLIVSMASSAVIFITELTLNLALAGTKMKKMNGDDQNVEVKKIGNNQEVHFQSV